MSTLETAEGVLGISDRGKDRLEDEMDDDVGTAGVEQGFDSAVGRAFWDMDEEDEVCALLSALCSVLVWCWFEL